MKMEMFTQIHPWIVHLFHRQLEVHRAPQDETGDETGVGTSTFNVILCMNALCSNYTKHLMHDIELIHCMHVHVHTHTQTLHAHTYTSYANYLQRNLGSKMCSRGKIPGTRHCALEGSYHSCVRRPLEIWRFGESIVILLLLMGEMSIVRVGFHQPQHEWIDRVAKHDNWNIIPANCSFQSGKRLLFCLHQYKLKLEKIWASCTRPGQPA